MKTWAHWSSLLVLQNTTPSFGGRVPPMQPASAVSGREPEWLARRALHSDNGVKSSREHPNPSPLGSPPPDSPTAAGRASPCGALIPRGSTSDCDGSNKGIDIPRHPSRGGGNIIATGWPDQVGKTSACGHRHGPHTAHGSTVCVAQGHVPCRSHRGLSSMRPHRTQPSRREGSLILTAGVQTRSLASYAARAGSAGSARRPGGATGQVVCGEIIAL